MERNEIIKDLKLRKRVVQNKVNSSYGISYDKQVDLLASATELLLRGELVGLNYAIRLLEKEVE